MGGVARDDCAAGDAHDATAEEVRCDPGERRNVVSDDPFVDGTEPLVSLDEQPADNMLPGQPPGGDVSLGGVVHSSAQALFNFRFSSVWVGRSRAA